MTSTAVVLGIATLGRLEPAGDCDCATEDAVDSIRMRTAKMDFIA
jgi:hypothetical protein